MEKHLICTFETLSDLECKEFDCQDTDSFVVRRDNEIFAYVNSCPHTGAALNWQENQFLDLFHANILCSLHGARFRLEDGRCIYGPCQGQHLKKVKIKLENGNIYCSDEHVAHGSTEPGCSRFKL